MKNIFNEKNALPLTFRYIKIIKRKKAARKRSQIAYYAKSQKYQTDFFMMEDPVKPLVRLV